MENKPEYPQPISFQQQYAYYPPAPAPPSEANAKTKIFNAFNMRTGTDRFISPLWVVLLVVIQLLMIMVALVMLFFVIETDGPYSELELTTEAILALILTFILQVVFMATQAVLAYKLVLRRDEHFRRDWMLREGVIEYMDAGSLSQKVDLNVERWTMNTIHQEANTNERERSAITWALLIGLLALIPVLGYILVLYALHFLSRDQGAHDSRQLGFNDQFQKGMMKLGRRSDLSGTWQPMPKRNSVLYVMLSLITLGLFIPYWWYVVIVDMNGHLSGQHKFENLVVESVQQEG